MNCKECGQVCNSVGACLRNQLKAIKLQNERLQNALGKMLKMYPASTFCEIGCENATCEHCALEREVLLTIEKRIDEVPPMPSLDGPEPTLSPEDQAALDALNCPRCKLPGIKRGETRCFFCFPR